MDLSRATCAACPPGNSSCPALPASRRRLHLPGLPLPGEAAAPRAQEFRADSPAGNSTPDASPAQASAAGAAGAEVPAQLGVARGRGCQASYLMHTRVMIVTSAGTGLRTLWRQLGPQGRVGLGHLSDNWGLGIFAGLSREHTVRLPSARPAGPASRTALLPP